MSRQKRPTDSYILAAKRLAIFAPSLRRYKNRKKLKPAEKSAIARKEKILRFTDHLKPLTKKQARALKGKTFAPGVQAIQLRNTAPDAKVKVIDNDMFVTSNGRLWLYWKLTRQDVKSKRLMNKAARVAFEMQFPVERVAELARIAFKKLKPIAVHAWTPAGRANNGFESIEQFVMWLNEHWQAGRYATTNPTTGETSYSDPDAWLNGIAILLHEKKQ